MGRWKGFGCDMGEWVWWMMMMMMMMMMMRDDEINESNLKRVWICGYLDR